MGRIKKDKVVTGWPKIKSLKKTKYQVKVLKKEKVILSEGIVTSVFTLPHKRDGNDKKS